MTDELTRVVDRATARAAGLSDSAIRHRIARRRWVQLHRGVYFTRGAEPREPDQLAGALLAAGPGAALSGAAALAQWRVRDIVSAGPPLILVPMSNGTRATATLRVRRTDVPYRAMTVNDLQVVSIARAVADYCVGVRVLTTAQAVTSEVVRRRLCTADQLAEALNAGPRRGSAHLRIAVQDVQFGAWSVPEGHLGRAMRVARLPAFEQNVPLQDSHGSLLGIVDVWWKDLRAAVEVLGAADHSSAPAWAETVRRAARIEAHGIAVMQVPAVDVLRRIDEVVERIRRWLAALPTRRPDARRPDAR